MITISTAELVSMQTAIQQNALPDTCTILSLTNVINGQGGYTPTWGTATASVACRLDPMTGEEIQTGGAVQPFTRWVMTLPYNTTVLSTAHIVHNSITYSVVGGPNSDESWIACTRVILEKI